MTKQLDIFSNINMVQECDRQRQTDRQTNSQTDRCVKLLQQRPNFRITSYGKSKLKRQHSTFTNDTYMSIIERTSC